MKTRIALFFSVLFLVLIVSPTVISFTERNGDMSIMLMDFGEEEENKGKESSESKIDSELKIYPTATSKSLYIKEHLEKANVVFQSKTYVSEYPNITTPPPKPVL